MADLAEEPVVEKKPKPSSFTATLKKRWRAWLRAIHRDIGYLAVGFTIIYAISGIAQNHLEDWGDVSYRSYEQTIAIAPIPAGTPDAQAIALVQKAANLGTPTASLVAGDEIRLEYANGAKVTALGDSGHVTIQGRERRAFIGWANWLHTARQKKAWKYAADAFAILLLYLAISGIFMIKGKLGFKWRGAALISIGVAVPVLAVITSDPKAKAKPEEPVTAKRETPSTMPIREQPDEPGAGKVPAGVLKPLPPDDESTEKPADEKSNLRSKIPEGVLKPLPPDDNE